VVSIEYLVQDAWKTRTIFKRLRMKKAGSELDNNNISHLTFARTA
jgi:hypothetical protein